MMHTFLLTLFRFDATTDYLPYTTKYQLDFESSASLKDLLDAVKSKDVLVGLTDDGVRINGIVCSVDTSLQEIANFFGQELLVEPLSTKRAVKDLHIDKNDFLERFDLLAPYVEKSDREFFQTLILLHYASPALVYNVDIFGSAFYYFCAKMVQKYPQFEIEITDIASEPNYGVQYHLPLDFKLFNAPSDLESEINVLIGLVKKHFPDRIKDPIDACKNPATTSLDTMLNTTLEALDEVLKSKKPKHSFSDFKAAIYLGSSRSISPTMEAAMLFSGVKGHLLSRTHDPDGSDLLSYDSNMAYRMAGAILLEAFDSGCDFLLVDDPIYLTLLDNKQKACAKAVGRSIEFPVLTTEQLAFIALGEIEASGVLNHMCKPQFLPA